MNVCHLEKNTHSTRTRKMVQIRTGKRLSSRNTENGKQKDVLGVLLSTRGIFVMEHAGTPFQFFLRRMQPRKAL
jgi:hypothetical protein